MSEDLGHDDCSVCDMARRDQSGVSLERTIQLILDVSSGEGEWRGMVDLAAAQYDRAREEIQAMAEKAWEARQGAMIKQP